MGRLGQVALIGENYVQEFQKKSHAISGEYIPVLIGPLQRNKVVQALTLFREIESVDRKEVIDALNRAASATGLVLPVFLQVNVSNDPRKKGFAVATVSDVAQEMLDLPALQLRGLMAITELYEEPEEARSDFVVMRNLRDALQQSLGVESLELSMGMSADFEIAIEEGATRVRIGEALFGPRDGGA
jgi:pyridoxal phosphate enzyme (YggS family)